MRARGFLLLAAAPAFGLVKKGTDAGASHEVGFPL
jgi:hypothetical protein